MDFEDYFWKSIKSLIYVDETVAGIIFDVILKLPLSQIIFTNTH